VSNKEEEKLYETFNNIGDGPVGGPGIGPGCADRRSAEKEEEKSANHPGGNARAKKGRNAN
jgi:hypothetical protein